MLLLFKWNSRKAGLNSDDSVDESINLAQLKRQMEEAEAAADSSGESSDEEDIVLADLVR